LFKDYTRSYERWPHLLWAINYQQENCGNLIIVAKEMMERESNLMHVNSVA
jgi:hypothetical protein